MYKTILLAIAFGAMSNAVSAQAEDACYKVEGMTCAACGLTTKAAIKKLDGIEKVTVSVDDKKAQVTFDPSKTSEDAIKSAIDNVGYKATIRQCKKS